jgi:hypothetical protein
VAFKKAYEIEIAEHPRIFICITIAETVLNQLEKHLDESQEAYHNALTYVDVYKKINITLRPLILLLNELFPPPRVLPEEYPTEMTIPTQVYEIKKISLMRTMLANYFRLYDDAELLLAIVEISDDGKVRDVGNTGDHKLKFAFNHMSFIYDCRRASVVYDN